MKYVWNSWSDGGAIAHTVSPINGGTYTASFTLIQTNFNRLEPPLLMEGGELILAYHGLPGNYYALERATRLGDPIDWIVVSTNVAATNGMLFLTNYFFDLENYFRIRQAGGP